MKTKGKVTGIISNIVIVKTEGPVAQNEIATVKLGEVRMMAEVIKVVGDDAYIQVFDSTRGLRMGAADKGRVLAAGWSGKVKTASTMVCIVLMLMPIPPVVDRICTAVIVLTTIYSGVEYFKKNLDILAQDK